MSSGINDFGGERLTGVATPTNDDHAANKKYVDEHGGGGSMTSRMLINGDVVSVVDSTMLPWNKQSGDDLLDLTDPTAPTILVAGVYAFNIAANGSAPGPYAVDWFWFGLDTDANADDAYQDNFAPLNPDVAPNPNPQCSQSLVYYMPAGALLQANVRHSNPDPIDFKIQGSIQRLS